MTDFHKISVKDVNENPFSLIGNDWMLITAGDLSDFNTMTASWGGLGVLWKKNVCFLFVRKSRYTFEYIEKSDKLTLSFFESEYRNALTFCGKNRGRDVDKCKETGLSPIVLDNGAVSFSQARLILNCKKLYWQDIDKNNFLDESISENYLDGDFHRVYCCEITDIFEK